MALTAPQRGDAWPKIWLAQGAQRVRTKTGRCTTYRCATKIPPRKLEKSYRGFVQQWPNQSRLGRTTEPKERREYLSRRVPECMSVCLCTPNMRPRSRPPPPQSPPPPLPQETPQALPRMRPLLRPLDGRDHEGSIPHGALSGLSVARESNMAQLWHVERGQTQPKLSVQCQPKLSFVRNHPTNLRGNLMQRFAAVD